MLARAGNQLALEALIKEYQSRIARYVVAHIGRGCDYEDLCQTIFVKMVLNLRKLKAPEMFEPWLFTIARNACVDYLRRRKWRNRIFVAYESWHEAIAAAMPEDGGDRAARVEAALCRLRADERELLALAHEKSLSYEELARISNISVAALKSRLFRARDRLRRILNRSEAPHD